jgi:predicted RecB family nuclease
MSGKITNDVLQARIKCRYKVHLKMAGEQGEPHDYELLLVESRGHVRAAATAKLVARHPGQEVPSGLPLTAELLKRGLPLLLNATFEDGDLSVRFDALVRAEGESPLGRFHYVPVLFHEAEKMTAGLRLLLGVHGVILGGVQGKEPAIGILFHGRACQERKVRLASVHQQARRMLREARVARTAPLPRLTLNDHCQVCEFRKRCLAEATAKDDLSLLRGMSEKEIAKYAKRGIFTVTQLSFTFRPPRRTKKPEQRKPVHSHALQALSIRERKVHVLGSPELPSASKRIYLDLEGDPERGFCYLAGMVVRDDAEERYSFWIDSPADEPHLLGQVLAVAARNPTACLYTYGGYEAAFLRRAGKAAGREEEVKAVLARLCNVLSVVHDHVHFPTYSNGLKDIAGHLGFRWSDPEASGIQSVVWRRRWEEGGLAALKDRLLAYNLEDCDALQRVTELLYAACPAQHPEDRGQQGDGRQEIARAEEVSAGAPNGKWCRADFDFINKRAYFDYQRDKILVRTSKAIRRCQARKQRQKRIQDVNREVEIRAEKCPVCGSADLTRTPHGSLVRLTYDLRFTRAGIRKFVTRATTSYHRCVACNKRFRPVEYLRLEEHYHGLKSWAMYEHVAHRTSLPSVADTIKECFGLPVDTADVSRFKVRMASYYEGTYKRVLEKLVAGRLLHADETEVKLRRGGGGYVWVFASLEEVVFMYRPSREGGFLHELLKDFQGVLVSDFYAVYDSLHCPQQKCLIHLIRDFNQDIQGNPWDEDLKVMGSDFGGLLRSIISTIDEHGLKRRHLSKHKADVDRFFDSVAGRDIHSEVAEGYRTRLLKCRDRLFTFLEYDGVPWNNNAAEHAIRSFASYRKNADGLFTEAGLSQYLVLLSLRMTCKYKGVSFLKFLLSGETDIDTFCRSPARRRHHPAVEVHPQGVKLPRPSRQQTWEQELRNGQA